MNQPRAMWGAIEPFYTVLSEPERKDELQRIGLKGGWMTYFAARAAPLGPVPPEIVIATFLVFAPGIVRRAVPDAWLLASPAEVLDRRLTVVDLALRRLLRAEVESPAIAEAADLARRATDACDGGGRPIFAANAALEWPAKPQLTLWHAANLLREHRGDGHVACLVAAGLDGCEAVVTHVAAVPSESHYQRHFRGWTPADWQAAESRLQARGWLDEAGALTAAGRSGRDDIERQTDAYAEAPWASLGQVETARLHELMSSITTTLRV